MVPPVPPAACLPPVVLAQKASWRARTYVPTFRPEIVVVDKRAALPARQLYLAVSRGLLVRWSRRDAAGRNRQQCNGAAPSHQRLDSGARLKGCASRSRPCCRHAPGLFWPGGHTPKRSVSPSRLSGVCGATGELSSRPVPCSRLAHPHLLVSPYDFSQSPLRRPQRSRRMSSMPTEYLTTPCPSTPLSQKCEEFVFHSSKATGVRCEQWL